MFNVSALEKCLKIISNPDKNSNTVKEEEREQKEDKSNKKEALHQSKIQDDFFLSDVDTEVNESFSDMVSRRIS